MAVVVWVYSGGGEAEVRGLFPFLDKTFPGCKFERKTPVRDKPGPKPNKASSYGRTGKSLIDQIKQELPGALKAEPNKCDLILVFDDLDCRDSETQKLKILSEISKIPQCAAIEKFVGFAAPEIEAWIIADWNNSIAKHSDFRARHKRMCWWLSTEKKVSFENPESFSEYDSQRDCCLEKLSDALIESSVQDEVDRDKARFSKGLHTPLLLREIDPNEVQKKCPLFRELYNYLNNFCRYC
ncbi:DUF4276 family protein [Microcoleus vaginatus PCC 9802]|uniref:DUF4276 family protein n=1 Tax=Microcoleus vaginatus TaxID=119532 RepID=UPI00020D1A23|nr:hypothetical protein MicvaDRAFT_3499 [Microcoleus vaginatus FGP-2]UNU19032.1 DUF4276 family protein [Microcoleus vaginatus PCC 9802]